MRSWGEFIGQDSLPNDLVKENPILAVYGCFQVGKSTFINCLSKHYIALTGKGIATTYMTARYRYGDYYNLSYRSYETGDLVPTTFDEMRLSQFAKKVDYESGFHIEARVPGELLKYCDIVDTPGYNADCVDTQTALKALDHVHYVLFVMPNRGFSQPEKRLEYIPCSCSAFRFGVYWS